MHFPLWAAHRSFRYWAFPMMMLLALRFPMTVAPASAAYVLGGTGAHRSSQISTCSERPSRSVASKIRSRPNGTFSPRIVTARATASRPDVNCRFS